MNPVLSRFIFTNLLKVNTYNGVKLIVAAIVLPVVIYLVATVIDMTVDLILKPVENVLCKVLQEHFLQKKKKFVNRNG